MLEFCGAVLTAVTNCGLRILPFCVNKDNEAKKLDANWRKLQRAVNSLDAKREDTETIIKGNNVMKTTTYQWHNWVREVEDTEGEVKILEKKYKRAKRFHYITCRFLSKAELSREMATKADEIMGLANRMSNAVAMTDRELTASGSLSFRKTTEPGWAKNNVDQIIDFLKEESVKTIGVWAFAGMGKTTIMESLKDKLFEIGLFERVLFVTVEEENSEEKIGRSILEQLNLNIGKPASSHQIALAISSALVDKNYLLILDQVSREMDFRRFGIHENHVKGKVVLATRYKTVCDKMKVDESWEVKQMSENDAWLLFERIVGEKAKHKSKYYDAKLIVKECGGIPLLINAVATHLRTVDDDQVWSDCRVKLQSSAYDDLEPFSESRNVFKLVYGRLKSYRKKCFLYGALYPEDHEIYEDHLMECWRAEQFIPHAGSSSNVQIFWRARLEGHTTMRSLIDACLLKRCKKVKYVTMPNLFRTWALKTDEGGFALVQPLEDGEKFPHATWVSLKCKDLSISLQQVDFDRVTTLFLQRNELQELALDRLFAPKSILQVVDLGYTGIRSLPSSISNLVHLKALYLNDCSNLSDLPADIANLNNVEILDISRTGISHWPAEIGSMGRLRCLRVSFARNVGSYSRTQVLPAQSIIGKLSSLEELSIFVDEEYQNQWNGIFIDDKWNNVVQGISKQVAALKYLKTLHFYFPSVKLLKEFVENSESWKNLDAHWGDKTFRSFKIVVGSFWRHHEINVRKRKAARHLKFFAYHESSAEDESCSTISTVLMQACTFELIGHRTVAHLSAFGLQRMEGLKICAIKDCNQMTSITHGNYEGGVLKELEEFQLINLSRLARICDGSVGDKSFGSLTSLRINNCQALNVVLSGEMIQHITLLEHLRVENCSTTTTIVEAPQQQQQNNHQPSALLPKLKSLELINLPALNNICQRITLRWNSLRAIEVDQCLTLQNFPSILSNADNLRLIKCQSSWWNELNLESGVRDRFQCFCQFIPRVEVSAEEIVPLY